MLDLSPTLHVAMKPQLIPALLLAAALAAPGLPAAAAEEVLETTAECVAKTVAEYDAKIAKAEAEGKDKAVALFKKRKAEFSEGCKVNDRMAEMKRETAESERRTAESEWRTAELQKINEAYTKFAPTLRQVVKRGSATKEEMNLLIEGYRATASAADVGKKQERLQVLRGIIEKLGGKVD